MRLGSWVALAAIALPALALGQDRDESSMIGGDETPAVDAGTPGPTEVQRPSADPGSRDDTQLSGPAGTNQGADFEPRENADVKFQITSPDGQQFEMTAEPSDTEPGVFEPAISTTVAGAWKATATALVAEEATADRPASNEPLTALLGWAYQRDQKEMRSVAVNRTLLDEVSRVTKGKTLELDELESLTRSLPQSSAPLTEIWSWPIWHSWWVFATALACLVTDWTLRRRSGLP